MMVSMTLISVIFLMIMQSFNAILLGSYLIDARTAVRNESEFVGEYFKLRVKNADPRSVTCNNTGSAKYITWQSKGSSDSWVFFAEPQGDNTYRFCMYQNPNPGATPDLKCHRILTYNDVRVTKVDVTCEAPDADRAQIANVNLNYTMESTAKLGDGPAVKGVSRFVTVSIR